MNQRTRNEFLSRRPGNDLLTCPICGDDYIHIDNVRLYSGPDDYRATVTTFRSNGHSRLEQESSGETPTAWRGNGIVVTYFCEAGNHEWAEARVFHKGNVWDEWVDLGQDDPNALTDCSEAEAERRG